MSALLPSTVSALIQFEDTRRKAGVRRQTAVTAMSLKLRPTGLGSGIDKDRADYTV